MLQQFVRLLRAQGQTRFAKDTNGGVAIAFGLCAICMFYAATLAIDSSRMLRVGSKVQAALDAAALAGAKVMDREGSTDAEVKAAAKAHFDLRMQSLNSDETTVTSFKAEPDRPKSAVATSARISMKSYFGSLAKHDQVVNSRPTAMAEYKSKRVEVALVLDITGSMAGSKIDGLKVAAKDFVDNLYASNPEPGAVKVSLVPYSAAVNLGTRFGPATIGYNSDTCVIERDGAHAFDDTPPSFAYFDYTNSTANPNYSCPTAQVEPLTDLAAVTARDAFKARIDAMQPGGGTAGHIGTQWGWFTISPRWSGFWPASSAPKSYGEDIIKTIVVMTDGEFNLAYRNGAESLTYPMVDPLTPGTSTYQALRTCENIRAATSDPKARIKVYTVAFQTPPAAEQMLKDCGGASNFYNADNNSQLLAAFRSIVNQLYSLRVAS